MLEYSDPRKFEDHHCTALSTAVPAGSAGTAVPLGCHQAASGSAVGGTAVAPAHAGVGGSGTATGTGTPRLGLPVAVALFCIHGVPTASAVPVAAVAA